LQKRRAGGSGLVTLSVWGDPIVGQALVLLLRGSGYEAKFMPALPSSELPLLKDIHLLVLTPTPQLRAEERETLLASLLRRNTPGTTKLQVLELVVPSEETQEGHMRNATWHGVPWPCRLETLEQHIEAVVFATL
jgi:hypothetical protein